MSKSTHLKESSLVSWAYLLFFISIKILYLCNKTPPLIHLENWSCFSTICSAIKASFSLVLLKSLSITLELFLCQAIKAFTQPFNFSINIYDGEPRIYPLHLSTTTFFNVGSTCHIGTNVCDNIFVCVGHNQFEVNSIMARCVTFLLYKQY